MADLCKVDDCTRTALFKQSRMCRPHRIQFLHGRPFSFVPERVKPGGPCLVESCDKPSKNQNYCITHYNQQLQGKPFTFPKPRYSVSARDVNGHKRCSRCEQFQPEAQFSSSATKVDGLQAHCKTCKALIYQAQNEVVRDKNRKKRFGLDKTAFEAMFEAQGFRCAICRSADPGPRFWAIDHDHACCPGSVTKTCGECVRGILCMSCNHGIGSLRDDPVRMRAAADYVERMSIVRGV